MAEFPLQIYEPRAKANDPSVVYDPDESTQLFAEDVTKLDAEVVAIEQVIGQNPAGPYNTITERIEAVEESPGFSNPKITVGTVEPINPQVNELWLDTN